jgi:integrin alpha 8
VTPTGQIYSFSLSNPKDRVYSTGESTAVEDDSYLGYSSITGDFLGTGEQGAAFGMPRGGGLLGKVLLFTWNMTNFHNITGEQIGAYFGYSLCSIDVDGDGLDDLIIGAPMYTEPNNEGKYETGRVYIMYQSKYVG